jgi:adenine phosphoribosyltransferase
MTGSEADRLVEEIRFVGGHADVWRLFDHAARVRELAAALVEPYRGTATKVAGIESRGFVIGTAAALELDVGFVPIRKAEGLFPGPKATAQTEEDYRGNRHTLRLQRSALNTRDRVLLVDDWIETGSQARAAKRLVEECGAELLAIATVVLELDRAAANAIAPVHALVRSDQLRC